MKSRKVKVEKEVRGVKIARHEREVSGSDTWDYYDLVDGRRCVFRNGFFWEWLS